MSCSGCSMYRQLRSILFMIYFDNNTSHNSYYRINSVIDTNDVLISWETKCNLVQSGIIKIHMFILIMNCSVRDLMNFGYQSIFDDFH